ncbi:MAG TPA: hypothetical protein VK988_04845 [Acidimicrobiales bacterium]|nr:hypothetical protein [Acidimicrobiales bacterium]
MSVDDRPAWAKALVDWVAGVLVDMIGLSPAVASAAAEACCFRDPQREPSSYVRAKSIGAAATTVAVARATPALPNGRRWWREGEGQRVLEYLRRGSPDEAEVRVGELLAGPAPDVMDFNWPPAKVFWAVPVPEGLGPGDRFVVGDGMGSRGRIIVTQEVGRLGAVLEAGSLWDPLAKLYRQAYDEASALRG